MSGTSKKHHKVRKLYLRRFADRRTGQVATFDKPTMRRFSQSVSDAAATNRYYEMPRSVVVPGLPLDWLEHGLSRAEAMCAPHL